MAKIIAFGEFQSKKKQEIFERNLQTEIEAVEAKLGLEDEPLLVLTDTLAMTVGNCLLDARSEINRALEILGIEEGDDLPNE